MQFKFLRFSLMAFMAMIVFSSCKKSNKEGRYIPSNAGFVLHINSKALQEKLPWNEIKSNAIFESMKTDTSVTAFMKSIWDNPENTGIDMNEDLILFMVNDTAGNYMAAEGVVKDKAKFAAMQAQIPGGTATEKDKLNFYTTDKSGTAWNDDKFVVIVNLPKTPDPMSRIPGNMDDTSAIMDMPEPEPVVSNRDLAGTASEVLNLSEGNSLAKNERFTELMNTKGDVHVWINVEEANRNTPGMAAMSMINLSKLYEGSIMTATINFADGKIEADVKSYANKEMTDIWNKYEGDAVSTDMIKRLPAKDVAVLFSLNFKPEGLKEFLKLAGLDGFVNMGSSFLGFNLDDFVKANKGEILFSVSDITMDSAGKPQPKVLFAAAIGDKDAFGKIIASGKKMGEEKIPGNSVFYNLNEKLFAIGNDKNYVDQYINKENNSDPAMLDRIKGTPVAGYVNIQYLLNSFGSNPSKMDSLELIALNASKTLWKELIIKGGEVKKGASSQHWEITMQDEKTNSLKQLNSYAGVMGNIINEKKKKQEAFWGNTPSVDTTFVQ